jgi:hypothetical protein
LCVCVFFEGLNGVCPCWCFAFSVKLFSPFVSKSRTTRWGSQEVLQGLLRCLGGGITRGDAVGVLSRALASWWWHHSRRRGLAVASLEQTRGLLSRFDRVYSGYITQGCPGGALAVAMSLRARCFFFPTHTCAERQAELERFSGLGVVPCVMKPRLEAIRWPGWRTLSLCVSILRPCDGVPAPHRIRTRDGRWLGGVWVDGPSCCAKILTTHENRALDLTTLMDSCSQAIDASWPLFWV